MLLCFCAFLKIDGRAKDVLVLFIRACLPRESKLENVKNYSRLVNIFDFSEIEERKICGICSKTLEKTENCEDCAPLLKATTNINKGETTIIEMACSKDLEEIIENNWKEILAYKNYLSLLVSSDICNSNSYFGKELTCNSISLILFIDGSPFSKSIDGSIWGIFGYVANLPPRLRARFFNILKVTFISGRLFNFNGVYDQQMEKFRNLIIF